MCVPIYGKLKNRLKRLERELEIEVKNREEFDQSASS